MTCFFFVDNKRLTCSFAEDMFLGFELLVKGKPSDFPVLSLFPGELLTDEACDGG